jgi:hypothetical protein
VEAQDIHIEGAQVLQMEDSGDLVDVEGEDRDMEAGEFTALD